MEVIRSNFNSMLPLVEDALSESTFVSFDIEMTGLYNTNVMHAYDTAEERYHKVRKHAMDFLPVQFGLGCFKYDTETERFSYKAFNFYIFPHQYSRLAPDRRFLSQSSSLQFLAENNFDFNKLFSNGISYLKSGEEARLREQIDAKRAWHQDLMASPPASANGSPANLVTNPGTPIEIPEQHKEFLEQICSKIDELLTGEKTSLDLEPCNAYLRKLTYQTVRAKYPSGLHFETKKLDSTRSYIGVSKASENSTKAREQARYQEQMEEVDKAVGFSKILKLITKSGKLVIGHNMMLDVCHVIDKLHTSLPESYEEFKSLVQNVFPRLLDTKYLCSTEVFRDKVLSSTLGDLLQTLQNSPFKAPVADVPEGFTGYDATKAHEAGYDAYITGLCFIGMVDYIASKENAPKAEINSEFAILESYINKLHLMMVRDIPYMNMAGSEVIPDRKHVFHVRFPKEWKTSDIFNLLSPYGRVHVTWIDDKSAWVSLNDKHQASQVINNLGSLNSATIKLLAYEDYVIKNQIANFSPLMPKRLSSGGEGPHVFSSPRLSASQQSAKNNRKRSLSDSEVTTGNGAAASGSRKRKLSSDSPYSRKSFDPIPEEEEEEEHASSDKSPRVSTGSNVLESTPNLDGPLDWSA